MQTETMILKENLKKELKEVAKQLNGKDHMRIALHFDVTIDTIRNNLRGNFDTKIEQAESILAAAKNIASKKELQNA